MLFVDGENFTMRAQELAKRKTLDLSLDPRHYLQDVFAWIPYPANYIYNYSLFPLDRPLLVRSYYCSTSAEMGVLRGRP